MPNTNRSQIALLFTILAALSVSSCGGGGGGGASTAPGTPPINRAPVATNDFVKVANPTAPVSVSVLANDTDADNDALTVTIEEAAPIGVATANANGTVGITSLPGDFKGVTRFKYRVKDPDGLSSVATAAVFIGADPFRVLFAGDANSNGNTEVYLADFATAPLAVTSATEGTLRLRGFVASDNGSTVVYRRQDTASAGTSDLSFVRTATPTQQVRIALPSGNALVQDAAGADQYRVSADGQWIAFIARDASNVQSAYTVNVATPTTVSKVNITGTQYATLPRFSSNSKSLYLLAGPSTSGANKSLYTAELGTANVGVITAPNAVSSADDVLDYSVASDQSRVVIRANRGGRVGFYFINTSQLQTEVQVNHSFALTESARDTENTVGLPPSLGGSGRQQRVAYTTLDLVIFRAYVADVSATPNPRQIGPNGSHALGFRPDDNALLYARGGQVWEADASVTPTTSDQVVSAGTAAWYDSTGNIVLVRQALPSGGTPDTYPALAVTTRGSFGSTQPLGTPTLAASYFSLSGFDRAVVILGEGPTTGAAPTSARLALVNAVAPDKLLYLADFQSPLQLSTPVAQVVTR